MVFTMKPNFHILLLSLFLTVNLCKLVGSNKLNITNTVTLKDQKFDVDKNSTVNRYGRISEQRVESDSCNLTVEQDSANIFTHTILKYRYNFVHLKLNFVDLTVSETKPVINKNDWIWTYKGLDGAHQYLYLPGDFGYLSFGLLWSHTLRKPITINFTQSGGCHDLKVGEFHTDYLIGNALGIMTSKIAAEDDNYNSSYWCYNTRVWLHSWFLYYACKNSICTFQTFEYRCCKFLIDFVNRKREVQCGKEHYKFGELWWMLPIIIGEVSFAFYPILLTKIGMKVQTVSKRMQRVTRTLGFHARSMVAVTEVETTNVDEEETNIKYRYISPKSSNLITFTSTILSPLYGLNLSGPIVSRLLRIWIIILPMTLSTIRVLIDYVYAKDVVKSAVKKGALVGFSSIIAGPSEAREQFLYIFNGPVTALTIYVVFGCMLIVFPRNFESFLDAGFAETQKEYVFLVKMPLKLKERLSGLSINHYTGYNKMHKMFLAQIFMLLHIDFLSHALKFFYFRWLNVVFPKISNVLYSMFMAILFSVCVLPLYIVFSIIELCLTVLYFAFPVINCFFIILKVFLIHYAEFCKNRCVVLRCIFYILFLPMLIAFCISWYIYCLLFFDGLWFLSKIAMFTYSGIIAYPRISYGYLVLVLMAIYYLTESLTAFGEKYRQLLKLSIETCDRFQSKYHDDSDSDSRDCDDIRNKYGIKGDLFFLIVDRHLPRRNQVLITILKFTLVITILTVSVELLITFDKFQELSLVSHVFTVLFICALPKIIRMMCMGNSKIRTRRKVRQKIYRTVASYVRNRKRDESNSANDEGIVLLSRRSGYETFRNSLENDYHVV